MVRKHTQLPFVLDEVRQFFLILKQRLSELFGFFCLFFNKETFAHLHNFLLESPLLISSVNYIGGRYCVQPA